MIESKRDLSERDDEIYVLRTAGASLAEIARQFNISRERVRQLYQRAKERKENHHAWPPLRRMLSNRTRKALRLHYRDECILENPRKIAEAGRDEIRRIRNIGEKSMKELAVSLHALGVIEGDDAWL